MGFYHLGSSSIQLDANGSLINREEYYPFGETSYGSYGKKRYRFCGKEKDEESGLYYYGMRYYSAWTCRFMSVDPLTGGTPFLSPYCYANCNPIMMNDPTGGVAEAPTGGGSGNNNISSGNSEGGKEPTKQEQRRMERAQRRIDKGKESKWDPNTGQYVPKHRRRTVLTNTKEDAEKNSQAEHIGISKEQQEHMGKPMAKGRVNIPLTDPPTAVTIIEEKPVEKQEEKATKQIVEKQQEKPLNKVNKPKNTSNANGGGKKKELPEIENEKKPPAPLIGKINGQNVEEGREYSSPGGTQIFNQNDWQLNRGAINFLNQVAKILNENKDFKIEIDVYTSIDNGEHMIANPERLWSRLEKLTSPKDVRTSEQLLNLRKNVILNYLIKTLKVDPSQIINSGNNMFHYKSTPHFEIKFLRK